MRVLRNTNKSTSSLWVNSRLFFKSSAEDLKNNLELTHKEEVDLLVFLRTLTDKEFLFNNRFSYPHIN